MGFQFMPVEALSNDLDQSRIEHCRQSEVLIEAPLPAQGFGGNRFWPQFRQAQFFEGDFREIQDLRTAVVGLAIDAILVLAAGIVLNAFLRLPQQHRTRSEYDSSRRANAGTSGLQSFCQTMAAEFALGDPWIETDPLESRNVMRTGDRAVAASDALFSGPIDHAGLWILL
jgi:hypothetical protein